MSKNHVDKPGKIERVCDLLVQFRAYVLYHIKATKTELYVFLLHLFEYLHVIVHPINTGMPGWLCGILIVLLLL